MLPRRAEFWSLIYEEVATCAPAKKNAKLGNGVTNVWISEANSEKQDTFCGEVRSELPRHQRVSQHVVLIVVLCQYDLTRMGGYGTVHFINRDSRRHDATKKRLVPHLDVRLAGN